MKSFEKKKLKYTSKDNPENIFKQIRIKTDQYLASNKGQKNANIALWLKFSVLLLLLFGAYYSLLFSHSIALLFISYLLFGGIFLIIGINIGHDAAHHCITGNKKKDDILFTFIFGLQGMSGYMWQIRHNFSHHIFPNVYNNDVDMELSGLILLDAKQKAKWFHKYQHLYAPFIYIFASLAWIFVQDFNFLLKKEQANLKINKIPTKEWIKIVLFKISYILIFLVIPFLSNSFSLLTILSAFIIMHFCLSLFLTFTFFISHHVTEVDYFDADENSGSIDSSWLQHQIITTIDFNPESKFANFIFGGFNLHIAHHIFPDVSHIHYPAITKIVKETLEENNADWYKSFSFFEGVRSHLTHLKLSAKKIIKQQAEGLQSNTDAQMLSQG